MKKLLPLPGALAAGILSLQAQVNPPPPATPPVAPLVASAQAQDDKSVPVTAPSQPPVTPAPTAVPAPVQGYERNATPLPPAWPRAQPPPPLPAIPSNAYSSEEAALLREASGRFAPNARGFVFKAEPEAGVIAFDRFDQASVDQTVEDLKILGFILNKNLERNLGEGAPDLSVYRMGVPMLLESGGNQVKASYIEGFGALLELHVRFPLAGRAKQDAQDQTPKTDSEWERARLALQGQTPADDNSEASSRSDEYRYNPKIVEILTKTVVESLKNAAKIRHIPPEEYVAVEIVGTPNTRPGPSPKKYSEAFLRRYKLQQPASRDPARATLMTVRVKKADADALAVKAMPGEEFERRAQVHSYLGGVVELSPGPQDYGNPGLLLR